MWKIIVIIYLHDADLFCIFVIITLAGTYIKSQLELNIHVLFLTKPQIKPKLEHTHTHTHHCMLLNLN